MTGAEPRPPLDWNRIAWAVGGICTVLTALFASCKSCAVEEAHYQWVEEADSTQVVDDEWKDSVRITLTDHERRLGPVKPNAKKLRRVRVTNLPWWKKLF